MTPEKIAEYVAAIVLFRDDDEKAHAMEDRLHQNVLQAIAEGACADPAACAAEALKTLSIDFERWCA